MLVLGLTRRNDNLHRGRIDSVSGALPQHPDSRAIQRNGDHHARKFSSAVLFHAYGAKSTSKRWANAAAGAGGAEAGATVDIRARARTVPAEVAKASACYKVGQAAPM